MKRTVIKIDEEQCNGCGACVKGCHEGVLQLINGKAVMVSDLYCDGLGACIGECPVNAIGFEEREAEPYDEEAVMERLIPKGESVILAHLTHLKKHGASDFLQQGLRYLEKKGITIDFPQEKKADKKSNPDSLACGCPGSAMREIKRPARPVFAVASSVTEQPSELRQFPVQLHLLHPSAGFLRGADLLLAADCTAFAYGNFHNHFLKGKALAIACPKLDANIPAYIDKLVEMIDVAAIRTLTVLIMEVPCCNGLLKIARIAGEQAKRNISIEVIVLSVHGEIIKRECFRI